MKARAKTRAKLFVGTRAVNLNLGDFENASSKSDRGTESPTTCSSIKGRSVERARDFVNVSTTFSGPAFPPFGGPFKGMMDARHATRLNTPKRGSMDI